MDESIKILLVEDHLINQKVITHMVDKISNASVEAVSSGEGGRGEPVSSQTGGC